MAPMSSSAAPGSNRVSASSARIYSAPRMSDMSPLAASSSLSRPCISAARAMMAPRLRSRGSQRPSRAEYDRRRQRRRKPPPYFSFSASKVPRAAAMRGASSGVSAVSASGRSASRAKTTRPPQPRAAQRYSSSRAARAGPEPSCVNRAEMAQTVRPSSPAHPSSSMRGISRGREQRSTAASVNPFARADAGGRESAAAVRLRANTPTAAETAAVRAALAAR